VKLPVMGAIYFDRAGEPWKVMKLYDLAPVPMIDMQCMNKRKTLFFQTTRHGTWSIDEFVCIFGPVR
jgi:hypothetical protein